MLVGFLNQTPFSVSASTIRTFNDYTRSGSGRWSKHDLIGQKPKLEFLGPDIEKSVSKCSSEQIKESALKLS